MWYLVLRQATKPRTEWTVTLDQHLVWMKRQHDTGKILFSGPTTDRKYGIYVIRADSKDEARGSRPAIPTRRQASALSNYSNGKCIRSWARGILPRRGWSISDHEVEG